MQKIQWEVPCCSRQTLSMFMHIMETVIRKRMLPTGQISHQTVHTPMMQEAEQ